MFEHRSTFSATLEALRAFHEDPRALGRLTPPPLVFRVQRDDRTSLTEGELAFTLWMGPVPVRWVARHEPGPTPHGFTDRMLEGPLADWVHAHIFRPVEGGVELVDRVTLTHKAGWRGLLTRLFFGGLALRMLFVYRHWQTRRALAQRDPA